MHKHLCLGCGETITEGDFDCEYDIGHDFALCDSCAEAEEALQRQTRKDRWAQEED